MKITISSRSGKSRNFPLTLDVSSDATVEQLKEALHKKAKKYYPARQRLFTEQQLLQDNKELKEYDIKDGDTILFKDLGPQISWRTVFFVEYIGPLILHPILYHFKKQIYGEEFEHSDMQKIAYYMVMSHFIKREFETLFIHRFSHGTMPARNIFKNSFHYHLLSGLNLAYWLYGPWNALGIPGAEREKWLIWTCVAVFVYGQISNFSTHVTLRNLRPPGTKVRKIPRGYGFGLVSCPNYFFETIAWISVCVLTRSLAAVLFILVGFVQMYFWAIKKHKNYYKEFKDYPKNRKAIIPFLL